MRNNIASFEKSNSSMVTICKRIDVEFIFAKEAILFLIYLLADDMGKYVNYSGNYFSIYLC